MRFWKFGGFSSFLHFYVVVRGKDLCVFFLLIRLTGCVSESEVLVKSNIGFEGCVLEF